MQRKTLSILFVVGLLTFALALPAFAVTTTEFSGELTHSDPFITGDVSNNFACDAPYTPSEGFHYQVFDYNAPVSGLYEYVNYWNYDDIEEDAAAAGAGTKGERSAGASRSDVPEGYLIDVVVQIYADGTFDPSDTLANCLLAPDDYALFELAAGDYDLVVLSYYEDEAGPYYFTITAPDAPAVPCPYPLPGGSVVYDIPAGAPAFYEASLGAGTGFNIPAGTWYVSEFVDDFAKVWISCQGAPVWVPSNAVAH